MKTVILLSLLLLLLSSVINSQSPRGRITDPFRTTSKETRHSQMFGEEQARGIELPGVIQKNKKANKPSSVSYQPTKVTCKDTLLYNYTYNSFGECLTELAQVWTNNAWVNNYRDTYTYDNSGKLLKDLQETWTNNAWVNYDRFTYTYDYFGKLLKDLSETWTNNAWVTTDRGTYTYDNSGKVLTVLGENWSNNAWVNSSRATITYDNSGNLLTELVEFWTNNAWVNYDRFTYTYDNSENILTYLTEFWTNNAWVTSSRYTITYDNSGNVLIDLWELLSNNALVASSRYTYTYDNSGNRLTELWENLTNQGWVNYERYTYTADNNGNCIHGESYGWQNGSWVLNFGSSELMYNHNKYSWYGLFSVVDVEYASLEGVAKESAGIQSFNLQQNYPNPFNPSTSINYSLAKEGNVKLTVFNALGSKVATIVDGFKPAGNYSVQFNGNNLASGIYLYRLESGNYSAAKKFILMK